MGHLTNTQAAYKYYNDKFMRDLRDRAASLWTDNYRVRPMDEPATFLVYQDCDEETTLEAGYKVNPVADTCTCKFYTNQTNGELLTDDGEIVPCKHLLGLKSLVTEEIEYWTMRQSFTRDVRREEAYQSIIDPLTAAWAQVGK